MRLSSDVVIPDEKLTKYLLVHRLWDDKSKFLGLAGFTKDNPTELKKALVVLARDCEAIYDGDSEYGEFFRTEGVLMGPNGRALKVTAVWLRWKADGQVRFVTLKPRRENIK
ncbi:MAG: hypothetical protein HY280_10650 [Nitrospinae bacterium]|nr:hypothetical protein [Nitrospinota bacterium]